MKFGKRITIVNSLIIAFLTAVIVIAAAVAGATILRSNIHNVLIDTVTKRAAIISESKGIVPDDFDYNVSGVYLSVYLSDGTLKNGSFPGTVDLPIKKGVVSSVNIDGSRYYVYDFAVSIEGRDDIYLRGITSASYDIWFVAMIAVTAISGLLAAAGIILNIISVKKAVSPIDKMRREVVEITETKDITKRLSKVTSDDELAQLADDYNYMLDALEGMFRNHERFTSDVAHELRTPLTVIMSESDYALNDTKKLDDKDESLEVIQRQSKRLKAITDSLLEFTRLSNKLVIELSPVDISTLTEEFIGDYVFSKGIECHVDIEPGITIDADTTLYERMLFNLVDNAVKYGKEGGHVWIQLKREGEKATLVIRDDGVGMSKEALLHAFDRFYREEASRSDKSGLGLGLSFVKEIVRLFGAKIDISSESGKGTCVTLTFAIVDKRDVSFE